MGLLWKALDKLPGIYSRDSSNLRLSSGGNWSNCLTHQNGPSVSTLIRRRKKTPKQKDSEVARFFSGSLCWFDGSEARSAVAGAAQLRQLRKFFSGKRMRLDNKMESVGD